MRIDANPSSSEKPSPDQLKSDIDKKVGKTDSKLSLDFKYEYLNSQDERDLELNSLV